MLTDPQDSDEAPPTRDPEHLSDFPMIPRGLLEAIERRLPERWPNVEMPDRDIWVRCGQLKLLEFLKGVHAHQLKESAKENLT